VAAVNAARFLFRRSDLLNWCRSNLAGDKAPRASGSRPRRHAQTHSGKYFDGCCRSDFRVDGLKVAVAGLTVARFRPHIGNGVRLLLDLRGGLPAGTISRIESTTKSGLIEMDSSGAAESNYCRTIVPEWVETQVRESRGRLPASATDYGDLANGRSCVLHLTERFWRTAPHGVAFRRSSSAATNVRATIGQHLWAFLPIRS